MHMPMLFSVFFTSVTIVDIVIFLLTFAKLFLYNCSPVTIIIVVNINDMNTSLLFIQRHYHCLSLLQTSHCCSWMPFHRHHCHHHRIILCLYYHHFGYLHIVPSYSFCRFLLSTPSSSSLPQTILFLLHAHSCIEFRPFSAHLICHYPHLHCYSEQYHHYTVLYRYHHHHHHHHHHLFHYHFSISSPTTSLSSLLLSSPTIYLTSSIWSLSLSHWWYEMNTMAKYGNWVLSYPRS